ncbi:hypothetical protein V1507DRAFT_463508 [Lipomyces tetrasporus]
MNFADFYRRMADADMGKFGGYPHPHNDDDIGDISAPLAAPLKHNRSRLKLITFLFHLSFIEYGLNLAIWFSPEPDPQHFTRLGCPVCFCKTRMMVTLKYPLLALIVFSLVTAFVDS